MGIVGVFFKSQTYLTLRKENFDQSYKMAENKSEQKEVLDWIQEVLEEPLPSGDFAEVLKDGVILCRLMNKIVPGAIKKFKQKGPAFLLMENIQSFLAAIKKYGVPDEEVFQTPDLFEGRNIAQVTLTLYSLARITQKHPDYKGPQMGPKMATENKRNFTEEENRQGRDAQIGLQAGYNEGASQAGQNMGKKRSIMD